MKQIRLWVERQKDADAWRYLVELSADRNDDALFSSLLVRIVQDSSPGVVTGPFFRCRI